MGTLENERSLLEYGLLQDGHMGLHTGDRSVDINGKPVLKQNTGNWKACFFILALRPADCTDSICPSATVAQNAVFLFGLYLVALGTGGIKPCVAPFGADQFDDTDLNERVKKGSFFNWFYFSIYIGILISSTFLVWIQDNVGWGVGFGVPAFFMGIAIVGFLSGTSHYRFQRPGGSPITRMCQVLVAACRKWNLKVEELKTLVHLLPIWATGIAFSAVYAQVSTMFVEQGTMMDTTIGSVTIPPASLSTFDVLSVLSLLPIYDWLIVPIARKFTGKEKGITELQRMGIGLFISVLCMVAAAVVEIIRLRLAKELNLVDKKVVVPLSIFWQIPQYFLMGTAEIFMYVGQLEFFYEQSPGAMRCICSALYLFTTSLGYYLSSFILTIVTYFTTQGGKSGWIPDNLNEGHLDYFFWILAGISFLNLLIYLVFAKKFKRKKAS